MGNEAQAKFGNGRPFQTAGILLVLSFVVGALLVGTHFPHGGTSTDRTIIDNEEGSLADWYAPAQLRHSSSVEGGGEFNSGVGDSIASRSATHTGAWSAKQTIDTSAGSSGTRLFRWSEFRSLTLGQGAYVSVWVLIPQRVQIGGYFNLFQYKSKTQDGNYVDVFFQLGMFSRSDGSMYLKPGWGWGAENPLFPGGPDAGNDTQGKWFTPVNQIDVPVGHWFRLKAYIVPSAVYKGRLLLWQDDSLIYDFENVMTGYPNTNSLNGVDTQWAVNAYANGLNPSTYTQYVDDAAITPGRLEEVPPGAVRRREL